LVQNTNIKQYWFKEDNLLKPIDWEYFNSLSKRVQDALELCMRGEISIGKAAEIARLPFREFDLIRSKVRIPIRS
jgi:hypothetical protein